MIDITKVVDIEIDGIDHLDYPDYVDSYISFALLDLGNGQFRELNEDERLQVQQENPDWFYEKLQDWLN